MTVNYKWKEIWENREDHIENIDKNDPQKLFIELKRIDGFDVVDGGIPYQSLIDQNTNFLKRLQKYEKISSIFDVGCGCGANLYLFRRNGLSVGGIDYSGNLIKIAKKVLQGEYIELIHDEAINIPEEHKYDSVIANSVFSYFKDESYATTVLDKMINMSTKSIALIDVHNIQKKNDFIDYRRRKIEDYDKKYNGLDKFFYSKESYLRP